MSRNAEPGSVEPPRAVRSRIRFFLLAVPLTVLFIGAGATKRGEKAFDRPGDAAVLARSIVASMTLDELSGQVLLLGWPAQEPSAAFHDLIRTSAVGGVKIFGWNADDAAALARRVGKMQESATKGRLGIPLIVATDQEGGWVRHIRDRTSDTPGNMALGAAGVANDAWWTGYYIGLELKAMGVNMNFAPTVDVFSDPNAHVIGPRSFSADPVQVGELAVAYMGGQERAGIVSTAKHFPGHGRARDDSHSVLPRIECTAGELMRVDILPYRMLIAEGLPAIMSGHLGYPRITTKLEPASVSSYFCTELLRNELGFSGLLVTDDLTMGGVTGATRSTVDAAIQALRAGNDMILVMRTFDLQVRIRDRLKLLAAREPAFHSRLREAAERIVATKLRYLRKPDAVPLFPDFASIGERLASPSGRAFFFSQACRSVTIVRKGILPLTDDRSPNGKRILLVGQLEAFHRQGKKRMPSADIFDFPYYGASAGIIERLVALCDRYDLVVFCLVNAQSLSALKALKGSLKNAVEKVVVISALTPKFLGDAPWVESALAVYGMGDDSFAAGFAVMLGDFDARGRLPVEIRGIR